MLSKTSSTAAHLALRARAVSQLRGASAKAAPYGDAPDALRVLYDLASSPATAAEALALLHELQVYQVEVDLQAEELQRTHAEMEMTLARHVQFYDAAPVAYLCIEADTTLREANLTAERMLGIARDLLLGRKLDSFLRPQTRAMLHELLAQLGRQGSVTAHGPLQLSGDDHAIRLMHASVARDPAGDRFLLALADTDHVSPG